MEDKYAQETTEIKPGNKAKKWPQFLAAIIGEWSTRAARLRKELMNLNLFLAIFEEKFYPHIKALHIPFQMMYGSLLSSWI